MRAAVFSVRSRKRQLTGTVHGKVEDEADNVSGTHPRLRVLLVLGGVEVAVVVENLGDVETLAGVGPDLVAVDRKVTSVPVVAVVDGNRDESSGDNTDELVDDGERREGERNSSVGVDNVPVKRGPRVDAHASSNTTHSREVNVVGSNPSDPAEGGETLPDESREPEVDKHGEEGPEEQLFTRHGEHPSERTADGLVGSGVEGLVQRDHGETRGPDSHTGVDEEATSETGKTVTDKGKAHGVQKLVAKLAGKLHVEEEGHSLGGNDRVGVTGRERDVGHL